MMSPPPIAQPLPPAAPRAQPQQLRAAMLAVLLLAFALRAWRLDFQSFWSDEGLSLLRSSLPLGEMLERMPAEHVPGYFVALRGWLLLTGVHDYGLRAFSLLPSVLAVALAYRLAADSAAPARARWAVGGAAALLLAVNPFLIWYGQETRMYAWLLAAALASTVSLWRTLHARSRAERTAAAAAYALSTAACVYLHYFGALTPIAQLLYVLGYVAAGALRGLRGRALWAGPLAWLAGAAGALLLFAPWLPRLGGLFAFQGWREDGSVSEIPWRYLQAYAGGGNLETWAVWMTAGLALLGCVWWLRVRPAGAALLLTWLAVPFAAVLLLAVRNPDYHERYTIFLAAPLLLLVAAGVVALAPAAWERSPRQSSGAALLPAGATMLPASALLALLVALLLRAGWQQATDAAQHKPNFRSLAEQIMAHEQPGDVVIVDGPNPEIVFNHYYRGSAPVFDVRELYDMNWPQIDERLRAISADAARIWEVLFFHEPASVQVWLATQAWATEAEAHSGIRVTLYGAHEPEGQTLAHGLTFGGDAGALRLERSHVGPPVLQPGDLLQVTTDWFTLAPPPDYKFSLRLVDGAGSVALAQDYVPQNWFAPTASWALEQPARDQRAFLIPAQLAPGAYMVTLRLYDAASGQAAPTAAGEDVTLGTVQVVAP